MSKTPSLRDLSRKRPENVEILPTAAQRQVQQRFGRGYANAKDELLANQRASFPWKLPAQRNAEQLDGSTALRADVPPFDPTNPRHLRAWETIWDMGRSSLPSEYE